MAQSKAGKVEAVKAWAGEFPGGLSSWAFASKADARDACAKFAKPVSVRILRESDYRKLLAAAKRGAK